METISWADFEKLDIRVGTIIAAQNFEKAKKPAYQLTIDFGAEIGLKKSSAQITERYSLADLTGKQVVAIINFPPKQIANFISECLVLGVYTEDKSVVLLQPACRLNKWFKNWLMQIATAYYQSPLGLLKINCSVENLTALSFVDGATDANTPNSMTKLVQQQLVEYFNGSRKTFEIPFKQTGTPFQSKVWDLLYNIPYGKTVSYMELAKRYGDVKAIRAVASANGKNNLAIVIPCHRVIGSNATLTGYAGGLWRKKWLLDHEARHHSGVQQLF